MRRSSAALATICIAASATGTAASVSEPPDPCLLVTAAQAAPVFGATPAHSQTTGSANRSCVYTAGHRSMVVETRLLASQSAFAAARKSVGGLVLPIATLADAYSAANGQK